MADHKTCNFYDVCDYRNAVGCCPERCIQYKHKDAVVVVRCKDCKHWADGVAGCTDHVKVCKIGFYFVGENGYCVYGERRSDDKTAG